MKSTDIVTLFLERKDQFGCVGLSVKQSAWLSGQLVSEQKINLGQGRHQPLTVKYASGNAYAFAIYPNGAGFLKPIEEVFEQNQNSENEKAYLLSVIAKFRAEGNSVAADELEKAIK